MNLNQINVRKVLAESVSQMHEVLGLYSLLHDWTISNHALNAVFLNAYPGLTVSSFLGDDHGLYI
jgi:hypothetical protein